MSRSQRVSSSTRVRSRIASGRARPKLMSTITSVPPHSGSASGWAALASSASSQLAGCRNSIRAGYSPSAGRGRILSRQPHCMQRCGPALDQGPDHRKPLLDGAAARRAVARDEHMPDLRTVHLHVLDALVERGLRSRRARPRSRRTRPVRRVRAGPRPPRSRPRRLPRSTSARASRPRRPVSPGAAKPLAPATVSLGAGGARRRRHVEARDLARPAPGSSPSARRPRPRRSRPRPALRRPARAHPCRPSSRSRTRTRPRHRSRRRRRCPDRGRTRRRRRAPARRHPPPRRRRRAAHAARRPSEGVRVAASGPAPDDDPSLPHRGPEPAEQPCGPIELPVRAALDSATRLVGVAQLVELRVVVPAAAGSSPVAHP